MATALLTRRAWPVQYGRFQASLSGSGLSGQQEHSQRFGLSLRSDSHGLVPEGRFPVEFSFPQTSLTNIFP